MKQRYKYLIDIEAPDELLRSIAELHKAQHIYDKLGLDAAYYWMPYFGLIVLVTGEKADVLKDYRTNVEDWRWDQMKRIL